MIWYCKIVLLILLLVCTFFKIYLSINQPVAKWDESTNIKVVQDTNSQKSFPVLYYGEKPFYQKPPLWYYLNLPLNEILNLRLVSIISAIFIIMISVCFAYYKFGFIAGAITWFMLLTSSQLFISNPGGIFSTHTLTSADLDSLQILFILIVFISGFIKNRYIFIICGLATGLAVLTKGPLGFLPLIILSFAGRVNLSAWIISFVVVLPWYLFMLLSFGNEFFYSHFIYHLFYRASTSLDSHDGSIFYYIGVLINPQINPAFFLVLVAAFLLKSIKNIPSEINLCGIMAVLLILIPTFMGTKLAWYILPAYPFLAMFTGMVIGKVLEKHKLISAKI